MVFLKKAASTLKQEKPATGYGLSLPKKSPEEMRQMLREFMEGSILNFVSNERLLVHSCEVTDVADCNRLPRINVHIKYSPLEVTTVSYSQYRYDVYDKDSAGNERLVKRGDRNIQELGDLMCKLAGDMMEEKFDILAEGPWNAFEGKGLSYNLRRAESTKN